MVLKGLITREICDETQNKEHHVNQLIEPDLMIYTYITFTQKTTPPTPLHSTELLKIFFSLLTLFTAFLQKVSERGKNCFFVVVTIY